MKRFLKRGVIPLSPFAIIDCEVALKGDFLKLQQIEIFYYPVQGLN